jgi:hypothetical protein
MIAGVSTARVTESRVRSVESQSLSPACESQPRSWQFGTYGSHSFQVAPEREKQETLLPENVRCQSELKHVGWGRQTPGWIGSGRREWLLSDSESIERARNNVQEHADRRRGVSDRCLVWKWEVRKGDANKYVAMRWRAHADL